MRQWLVISAVILFISGCSSKFAYNNLDWLVYWYVDDYVELSKQQESIFDEKLNQWLSWHRDHELKRYIDHLNQVKSSAMSEGLTPEQVNQQIELAQQHWERLRSKLAPELAQMAVSLSDDQVVYLFAALEKENQEREENRADMDDEERLERRRDDLYEDVEEMIGKLTNEQKQIIELYVPLFESTVDEWIAYRRDVQQRARVLFTMRRENPDFVSQLTELMLNPDVYRSEKHKETQAHNRLLYTTMISEIHSTLTNKQKRKLEEEISAIIADLEDLMS
ncbi:DUF6279 family lipoprotein [Alteromonas facilis]|uniref:DUF6279 family lipoprotein n=1 Tax=Alteromonas facilis TaxID=2048004 RepID=UPI000C28C85B|nr:DUF6279 family lipoprotein [Alteromonas facilis]